MIISHRHRFIFFAVPRTATHALRQALRVSLGPQDWEQQQLTGDCRLPVPALAQVGHGHATFAQARAHLPEKIWREYFRFAFVRDPFSRFISVCAFLNRTNPHYRGRERTVMAALVRRPRFRQRVLVQPQWTLLADHDGAIGMDFVGRYESLEHDYAQVCDTLGLARAPLDVTNSSPAASSAGIYDAALADWVRDFYAGDFEHFGYSKEFSLAKDAKHARGLRG